MDSGGKPSTIQIVVLATSSALSAVFYCLYRSRNNSVQRLKSAHRISLDGDIKALLSESPGRCVPYAVVEGVVQSVKESLSSQFMENCKGVIERLTLTEEKMVWNRTTHLWSSTEKVIHQRTNVVPFVLAPLTSDPCPPGGPAHPVVRVLRPLEASELDLERTFETFHPAARSLSSTIGHFLSGERPAGVRETEEMLRVGESVTAVGELVLDGDVIKLQPPKGAGLIYFLSRLDYGALLSRQRSGVRRWRLLAALFGLFAASTLLLVLWRRYRWRRRRREEQDLLEEWKEAERQRAAEESGSEGVAASGGGCSVCLSRPRSCVFLECGHVCCCLACYQELAAPKTCPVCRATISRVVPLYLC